jgi:biopolymer transport protein ExbB
LKFIRVLAVAVTLGAALPAVAAPAIPQDLSVGSMFAQADWVVKLVIIGLLLASLITWTLFIGKTIALRRIAERQKRMNAAIVSARTLAEARELVPEAGDLLDAAALELELSGDALHDADGIRERVATRFSRLEAEQARSLGRGLHVLGTIGATAPFVGLFGTVWGIMNSFVGIAENQTTNLAVVAPGIAEALLATGVGLVVAIPAVVIYNHFARQVAEQRAAAGDRAAAILNIVSRDLSRGMSGPARKAA